MRKFILLTFIAGLVAWFALTDSADGGRRGGGFAGGRAGGIGGAGGARPNVGGGAVNPYGGASRVGAASSRPVVGPGGGSGTAGRGGGTITTKGGATIDYKGAAAGGTTGGGIQGGKYVGGIQVTGPGGRDVTKVGHGGAAVGPGGNVVAGKGGTTVGSGPQGSIGTRYQGGVAIGPHGAVGGKTQVGGVAGPGGVRVGGAHAGVASGPYGAVATRSTAVVGRGTYYRPATAIRTQGVYVRQSVAHYPCFRPAWYRQYPGAWYAAGWTAASVWSACTWNACSAYWGYPSAEPIYYNYGDNITYQDNSVYIDGAKVATAEEFTDQAGKLTDVGFDAKVTKEEDWMPLGVFAMVQGDEKTSNHIFQLAINKKGILRGNYYDAVMDDTAPVYGSVDPKTQRAAWTVGGRKLPIYESGIANLTERETTMLVHYGNGRSQQFSFVRVEEPDAKGDDGKAGG